MKNLLLITQAREIPIAISSIKKLDIPKVWFKGFDQDRLSTEIPKVIQETDYDNYIILSDDTTPEQKALRAVELLLESYEAATGYCNLDPGTQRTTVCLRPLLGDKPTFNSIRYTIMSDVLKQPPTFRNYFCAMCLTGARKYIHRQFPYLAFAHPRNPVLDRLVGRKQPNLPQKWLDRPTSWWGSDYNFSIRLQRANIPMMTSPTAFVYHLASMENFIVGAVEPQIIFDEHREFSGN